MTEWTIEHNRRMEKVRGEDQLRAKLLSLPADDEPFMLLEHKSGDYLSIAANGPVAAIVFQPSSRTEYALAASTNVDFRADPDKEDDWCEFQVGGTPTRVPRDQCIPLQTAIEVVLHYFRHRELLNGVGWVK